MHRRARAAGARPGALLWHGGGGAPGVHNASIVAAGPPSSGAGTPSGLLGLTGVVNAAALEAAWRDAAAPALAAEWRTLAGECAAARARDAAPPALAARGAALLGALQAAAALLAHVRDAHACPQWRSAAAAAFVGARRLEEALASDAALHAVLGSYERRRQGRAQGQQTVRGAWSPPATLDEALAALGVAWPAARGGQEQALQGGNGPRQVVASGSGSGAALRHMRLMGLHSPAGTANGTTLPRSDQLLLNSSLRAQEHGAAARAARAAAADAAAPLVEVEPGVVEYILAPLGDGSDATAAAATAAAAAGVGPGSSTQLLAQGSGGGGGGAGRRPRARRGDLALTLDLAAALLERHPDPDVRRQVGAHNAIRTAYCALCARVRPQLLSRCGFSDPGAACHLAHVRGNPQVYEFGVLERLERALLCWGEAAELRRRLARCGGTPQLLRARAASLRSLLPALA